MAGEENWWEAAPLVNAGGGDEWWKDAPVVGGPAASSLDAGTQARIAAAKAGMLEVSPERAAQQAEFDAIAEPQERSLGYEILDNIIGFDDGVLTPGEDIGRALNAGAQRGTAGLVGLPGTVGELMDAGMTRAINGVFGTDYTAPTNPLSGRALTEGLSELTGGASDYRGQGTAAQYAGTLGEFIPGAMAFGASTPTNMLRYGVAPALASETAGQATEGTSWEPYARLGGALIASPAINGIESLGRRIISPNGGADAGRLALAQQLDDAGIPLTAGQRVGNEALRRKEGWSQAGQDLMGTQADAFTRAALKTVGTDATRATPEVLAETAKRIGDVFDDVARGVDVMPTNNTTAALTAARDTYQQLAPTSGQAPIISNVVDAFADAASKGAAIPASTINVWRSRLSKLTTSPDAATRTAASEALEAVDDALNSTLSAIGRSDDVARLAEARGQWRNFLAIQKAASGAGEGAANGVLSVSSLRSAVATQGRAAYAQGRRGDLGELVRAAEGVMKRLPTSGTPEGMKALGMPTALWGGMGAGLGATTGLGAVGGAIAGAMAPSAMNALRMSRPVQAYLANQAVGRGPAMFGASAQANALGVLPTTLPEYTRREFNALAP